MQYLALEWVEGNTEKLPLLIELREFAITPSANFLEFLHRGRGVDWQFDQHQLHQHLLEFPTLVMFDGLDEVFDRATQSTVIDDIIRFSQQYPKAQVLVTSRIIGYNPDRLQHSGFRHFTIQSLNTDEIHEFINRWYDLSMGSDPDKVQLKQRLKDAIANSKAIANLADNSLLLTMMAILNRRQELPRDRADLYDQASRVLLYHWDVDYKRLQLPMDAIGRREKQEMLRAIAYEMQAGEEGLKGNLIGGDRLTRILTDYLRDQGFSEPREKANRLIQQLRERNFILCYRGSDTYGFMHRTFLEYFCAVEIVHRFEKQRTLTFKQLRDEVFGQHWQDETWHEVLRLICGAIDPKFAGELIEFLIDLEIDKSLFLTSMFRVIQHDDGQIEHLREYYMCKEQGFINLLLACDCLNEVNNQSIISTTLQRVMGALKEEICESHPYKLEKESAKKLISAIATSYYEDLTILPWLKECTYHADGAIRSSAVQTVARYWRDDPNTLTWLKECIQRNDPITRSSALQALVDEWKNDPDTLPLLKSYAYDDYHWRRVVVKAFIKGWKDDPEVFSILMSYAQNDEAEDLRQIAVQTIAEDWWTEPNVLELLSSIVIQDPFKRMLAWQINPRLTALAGITTHYPTHPRTFELLCDRAFNDPDEQLREWAQEQLKKMEKHQD